MYYWVQVTVIYISSTFCLKLPKLSKNKLIFFTKGKYSFNNLELIYLLYISCLLYIQFSYYSNLVTVRYALAKEN